MQSCFISFLILFLSTISIFAQYDNLEFYCNYTQEDSVIADDPGTPLVGTTNMAILLCVEKNQPTEVSIDLFLNLLRFNLEDYFEKATFGNYEVNVTDILVKSVDSLAGIATVFELPDTIVPYPPQPWDTSFVVNPWMVINILDQADSIYDFNDFDSDGDGIVDFLAFMLIKFANGWSTGTTGLSIKSFYTTDDTTSTGDPVLIDGTGYLGFGGDRAIIQRRKNANSESLTSLTVHELGHALFDFDDMLRDSYPHYALGQFCAMAGNGFGGIAALYNPALRISKGWASLDQLTSNTTINFSDFDLTGQSFYYELPYYDDSFPQFKTAWNQKFYLTYYTRSPIIRWQATWPVPQSPIDDEYRGILIWHTSQMGWWSLRHNFPIDIESAHGKWDWIIDLADTVQPPNDKRAIRSNDEDPLYGYDSLEVKYSYRWLKYDPNGYIPMSTYTDGRIGSETCFFNPLNPQNFSLASNPSSNSIGYGQVVPPGRTSPSGFKLENLRLEGSSVKANILIGDDANTITESTTLTKGPWAIISDITIAPGVVLTLVPGTIFYLYAGSSLTVEGTLSAVGTIEENITFDFVSPSGGGNSPDYNGIKVNAGGTISLQYCNVLNAAVGIATSTNFRNLSVDHCTFENCTDAAIQMNGPEQISSSILSSTFTDNDYAISVTNCNSVSISYNTITNNELGIYLSNVTNPQVKGNIITSNLESMPGIFMESSNGYVRYNTISGHTNGIHLGNSSPDIGDNEITDNLYHGIYIGSGSLPNMVGELVGSPPVIYPISGYNVIEDNGGWDDPLGPPDNDGSEIYISSANVLMRYGCNSIVDDRVTGRYLINTQLLMNTNWVGEPPIEVRVEYNFWGDHPVYPLSSRFGNLTAYYNPPYSQPCPLPQGASGSGGELLIASANGEIIDTVYSVEGEIGDLSTTDLLYASAKEKFLTADYAGAEAIYEQIINSNDTLYAKLEAYQKLYTLGRLSNKNSDYFANLYSAYSSLSQSTPDSLMKKMFKQLGSLSLIGKTEFIPAIDEFDVIIQHDPESEEAVYAEIDALTTALLVEPGDSTLGKKSGGRYLVKSASDYHSKVSSLLKSNFGSNSELASSEIIPEEFNLYQNYPNPFNPTTTIKYDIAKVGMVELVIYDVLGRRIKTVVNEFQNPGNYNAVFDASRLASGVYLYQLKVNDFVDTKKMILLK